MVKKYYPNEDEETQHKMTHAWAAGHINMLGNDGVERPNQEVTDVCVCCKFKERRISENISVCGYCDQLIYAQH